MAERIFDREQGRTLRNWIALRGEAREMRGLLRRVYDHANRFAEWDEADSDDDAELLAQGHNELLAGMQAIRDMVNNPVTWETTDG